MNGYKILADSYKKLVDEGKLEQKIADKEIRCLEFLADCDRDDICILFNSSAFNDILKGYLDAIITDAELDEEAASRIRESCRWVLDTKSASDVWK